MAIPVETALDHACAEAEQRYRDRNPHSALRQSLAAEHLPGGNSRTSLWVDPFPLFMAHGEGARLTDVDGHAYVDFLGEFTSGIFGHSPAVLKAAIAAAMESGINLSAHNGLENEMAARLCARFPSFERVRFCNSGTEAGLMAVSAAMAFTGRKRILVFEGAYHGGFMTFAKGRPSVNMPLDFVVAPYDDTEAAQALIKEQPDAFAAILVEPMLGAGGCRPASRAFLHGLRDLADRYGALLIFDEVQTARLSVGGRQLLEGVTPDLTLVGKFFGGGLAFGCFGGRTEVMALFDPRSPSALPHAGTFNNNTLVLAAGIAAIDHLLTDKALRDLNARGDRLREALNAMFAATRSPFVATGLGSLMNLHPINEDMAPALRRLLYFALLEEGIFIAARGLMALSLPLDGEDIEHFLSATRRFLARYEPLWAVPIAA